jgi:phage tail-like protein
MAPVERDDPYASYNFQVLVTGVSDDGLAVSGSFSEMSGIDIKIPPINYRNGSEIQAHRKIPGIFTYTDLTFKRGITGHVGFWNWIVEALNGRARRTSGSVMLLDEARQEVMRWNFDRGWPTQYTGPTFHAANNEIAIETLVIAVERIVIDA